MACEIHIGDIGTIFEVAIVDCEGIAVDITPATSLKLIFEKPDGTTAIKTATIYGSGIDGKVRYTMITGDLNQVGDWKLQAEITFPLSKYNSSTRGFTVFPNLI